MSASLEDVLDEIGRPDDPDTFTVDSDNAADWVMRKAAKATAEIARIDAMAAERIETIARWAQDAKAAHESTLGWARGLLADYHQRVLSEDPKRKTLDLPTGRVKSRTLKAAPEVADVEAFLSWAGDSELVRVKREPAKAEINKRLKVAGDQVLDPETGEVVPGLGVTAAHTTFTVVPS